VLNAIPHNNIVVAECNGHFLFCVRHRDKLGCTQKAVVTRPQVENDKRMDSVSQPEGSVSIQCRQYGISSGKSCSGADFFQSSLVLPYQ
jgi:hypothetical protein